MNRGRQKFLNDDPEIQRIMRSCAQSDSDDAPERCSHTPGPWFYSEARNIVFAGHLQEMLIASIAINTRRDEGAHNARLIAASPALLSALKLMLDRFADSSGTYGDHENEAIYAAYAAIAKAEQTK